MRVCGSRQSIQRGLATQARIIRLPAHVEQCEREIARVHRRLAARLGRDPTDEEIAAAADLPVEQAAEIKHATRVFTSLDRPVGDVEGATLGELVASPGPEVGEELHITLARETVRRVLEEMPEREREVIRLRYTIDGDCAPDVRADRPAARTDPDARERHRKRAFAELALRREQALSDAA